MESEHHRRGHDGPRPVTLLKPIIDTMPVEEQEAIKSLLRSVFPRLGSAYGGGGYGSDWLSHLIKRLPAAADRVALAKQVIEAADPLWFGSEVLRWLNVTDDEDKADSNTLTKDELTEVAKVLVERTLVAFPRSARKVFQSVGNKRRDARIANGKTPVKGE